MAASLRKFVELTEKVEEPKPLFRAFDTFTGAYGIDVTSYHITAENLRAVPIELGLIEHNFPDDWVDTYIKKDYAEIDPVIEQARKEAEPFHWFDVENKIKLTREQRHFLTELKEAGLTDGLAVPIFGPLGTMAYFGLGCVHDTLDLPKEQEMELQFACQQVHNRYIDITVNEDDDEPPVKLSGREKEVLSLVATGLSNNFVAERLGITENTVDTILRRAFKKLDVNNRMAAVLKGIGSGLILP